MQYRLLRNNKESGPFTKTQLEEMGLKPYDLLWAEGRGGAWQYASEIDDLKSIAPVVEEQPYDRFYKGKEKQTTPNKQNTAATAAAPKSPKPRFRISGDKIVMIDNTALEQPQPIENIVSTIQKEAAATVKPADKKEDTKVVEKVGPEWEEMYSEWKGEDKEPEPAAPPAKIQTFEEIKHRYEESKQKQVKDKQYKAVSATRQNIMAAIAIVVLAIGGYAGYKLNTAKSKEAAATTANTEPAEIVQDEAAKPKDIINDPVTPVKDSATRQPLNNTAENKPAAKEINNTITATENKPVKQALPPVNDIKKDSNSRAQATAPVKKTSKDSNGTTSQTITKNIQPETTPVVKKADIPVPAKDKKGDGPWNDVKKANTAAPLQIPPASETTTVKQVAPKKRISDYISINKIGSAATSGNGVQNIQLSVKNITDFPIDLAVVDIQYYGANGRYLRGETMYVKNIGSGDNVNVRVPDNRTARSINYKVSLVSSEQKTLYLVGD